MADAGRLLCAPVSTFLTARLSKGAVIAADPTCAQRTLLMNLETAQWDFSLLELFGLSADILPAIRSSAGDWGVIERKGRRIPLLATLGDQQAAAIGLGASNEGDAIANYGTGAFLLRHTGPSPVRAPGLLVSAAAAAGSLRGYYLEGTVHAAGTSFEWLRDSLGLMKDSSAIAPLSRHQAPCAGPARHRRPGAPRWDYTTKSAFFGLDARTAITICAPSARPVHARGRHRGRDNRRRRAGHARVAGELSRSDAMMAAGRRAGCGA